MKRLISVISTLTVAACAQAQLVLSNFSDASVWLASGSSDAVAGAVAGSVRFNSVSSFDNWLMILPVSVDISAFDTLNITGRVEAGHTSSKVTVNLIDSGFTTFASLDFSALTANFASFSGALGGSFSDLSYIQVTGDGVPGSVYNFTLDSLSLSVVPEPSSVALGLGAVALVGAVWFRRRKA